MSKPSIFAILRLQFLRTLGLAVLLGLGLAAIALMILIRPGQAVTEPDSGIGVSLTDHRSPTIEYRPLIFTGTGTITFTPSYTYYLPVVFNNYTPPKWTFLGFDEIRIKQIALSNQDPETIYLVPDLTTAYTSTAVLYKSTDDGLTWIPAGSGIGGHVQSIAVHPVTPTMLLAGTLMGDGVYYSYDSGEHWTPAPVYPFVHAVAMHPVTPTLWLAASYNGLIFGAAYIHRTEDGGNSWETPSDETVYVNAFLFDSEELNRVYACTTGGFRRSDDAGLTWNHISLNDCSDLAAHPYSSAIMYTNGDGVLKTENKGVTWTHILTTEDAIIAVAIHPIDPMSIYAATRDTVFRTTDAGHSWRQVPRPSEADFLYIQNLTVSRSGILYVGTEDGVWTVSFN